MLAMTGWLGGPVGPASAAEIKVMASVAIRDAYVELVPAFERASENKVVTMGADRGDDAAPQGRRDRRPRADGVERHC
jgi:hypothetical protein